MTGVQAANEGSSQVCEGSSGQDDGSRLLISLISLLIVPMVLSIKEGLKNQ